MTSEEFQALPHRRGRRHSGLWPTDKALRLLGWVQDASGAWTPPEKKEENPHE